ncbi:unnamed protein product [Symbiodinium pilosum]|uniref:EXS domain-containing protein n=1 Tax=Symbiodinium pilosum TaxID=2952 RepID=A0A812T8U4_SYMPI|nr:unnamed protein product [Symbiodinium pilosum]
MTLVNPISHRSELVLSFFLGSSLALFLAIGVLLALPEKSPKTFSEAYFLTPIPVFRVVFSYLLILWCMGAVAKICDQWDVNHLFILNVDPRCRVTPEFFFARAATLTTIWILIFGMYVVDYKWKVLPTVWASDGFNKRSSFHFVFYPVVLLLLTVLGTLAPSTICRNRYKLSVLQSVKRTALAPVYSVDFADNMVGDVLTSIAKPIEDVPAAVCYLLSHHPQEEEIVKRFIASGVGLVITDDFSSLLKTVSKGNLGKYLCSLLVVIVSRTENVMLLIAVSTTATLYAFFWDVGLDWGLSYRESSAQKAQRYPYCVLQSARKAAARLPLLSTQDDAPEQAKKWSVLSDESFQEISGYSLLAVQLAGHLREINMGLGLMRGYASASEFSQVFTLMPTSVVTGTLARQAGNAVGPLSAKARKGSTSLAVQPSVGFRSGGSEGWRRVKACRTRRMLSTTDCS